MVCDTRITILRILVRRRAETCRDRVYKGERIGTVHLKCCGAIGDRVGSTNQPMRDDPW